MATTGIKKQFFILATLAGIIIVSLIIIPFIEEPIKEYVSAFFMNVEKQLPKPKETPTMNTNQSSPLDNVNQNVINEIGNKNGNVNTNGNDNLNGNINGSLNNNSNSNSNVNTNQSTTTPTPTATPTATPAPKKSPAALPTTSQTPAPTPEGIVILEESQATPTAMSELSITLLNNFFRILKVILWFILIVAIIRFINSLIFGRALRKTSSYELTNLIRNVVVILIYIIAFFIIFQSQYPTVQLAPLFTGSTIIGIVVGLALQDTLGNLFSGLAQQADQIYQVGDVISLSTKGTGVVESITWRGIKIRTFQNKLLVIGNSVLGKEIIEVAPKQNLNARIVFFNTLYTNPPAKTIQTVREAVRQCDNVSPKIRPIVRVRNLGDNGLDYEVKYWLIDYTKYNDTDALVRQRIWYAFQRENIDFAYPTRTLYIEKEPQPEVFVENENAIYERITGVPIFAPLSEAEAQKLAVAAETRIFAPGEPIVQQGERGGMMFIIHRGSVNVYLDEKTETTLITTLREGDFFGEMGLFTGELRVASVVAKDETEVLQISKATLKPVFENNPKLVQTLSDFIEERRREITQEENTDETTIRQERKTIIKSIRSFFGLDKNNEEAE